MKGLVAQFQTSNHFNKRRKTGKRKKKCDIFAIIKPRLTPIKIIIDLYNVVNKTKMKTIKLIIEGVRVVIQRKLRTNLNRTTAIEYLSTLIDIIYQIEDHYSQEPIFSAYRSFLNY